MTTSERSYAPAVINEPTAKRTSAPTSTGVRPTTSAIRPIKREYRDVAEQEARDDRGGPLQLIRRQAYPSHHVGQRQYDDVSVGRRERDRDRRQGQPRPGTGGHGFVITTCSPYLSRVMS